MWNIDADPVGTRTFAYLYWRFFISGDIPSVDKSRYESVRRIPLDEPGIDSGPVIALEFVGHSRR